MLLCIDRYLLRCEFLCVGEASTLLIQLTTAVTYGEHALRKSEVPSWILGRDRCTYVCCGIFERMFENIPWHPESGIVKSYWGAGRVLAL